jgi:hypothetical protein
MMIGVQVVHIHIILYKSRAAAPMLGGDVLTNVVNTLIRGCCHVDIDITLALSCILMPEAAMSSASSAHEIAEKH